jgi:hypothetical protein
VALSGADFEFVDKASLQSVARDAKPAEVKFTLPLGKRAGPQNSVTVDIDTEKRGSYRLLLSQADGVAHELPLTILPPNPKLTDLPIRLNVDEMNEPIHLHGSGLERIESISSNAGKIAGAADANEWSGSIALTPDLTTGQRFPLILRVNGLVDPITVPEAIEIVGPRPRILSVQRSLAGALGVEIGADELPVGMAAGFALRVDHLYDAVGSRLELRCEGGQLRKFLTLSTNEALANASLTVAGPGVLYLAVDPGAIGYAGCRLAATVIRDPEGRSDRFFLGRLVRVPRLDKFTLTTEKIGESSYVGILEGHDLDVIEKTGWDGVHGVPVNSIPTPTPGDASRQTVQIVLPWPAPGPHSPLYVWLRGGAEGRKTDIAY